MCSKPDFDRAQNEATKLLLRQNLNSLFFDIRTFRFDRKIHIDSVQNYAHVLGRPVSDFTCDEFSGCCLIPHPRCNLVLYDEEETDERRKHWGIVHEVGHVYMDHEEDGEKEEIEAHFFAAQLVAPEIILWEMCKKKGKLYAIDLFNHFNISHEAAAKRITTLQRRCCYNNAAIDQQLLSKLSHVLDMELAHSSSGFPLSWTSEIGNLHRESISY